MGLGPNEIELEDKLLSLFFLTMKPIAYSETSQWTRGVGR